MNTLILLYKKLSCRRETVRSFVSLNISLNHSRSRNMSFEMTPLSRACVSPYQYSIVGLTGSLLYNFRDKARYWPKIAILSYPSVFEAPVKGSKSEYCSLNTHCSYHYHYYLQCSQTNWFIMLSSKHKQNIVGLQYSKLQQSNQSEQWR